MSEPTPHLPSNSVDPDLEVGQVVGEYRVEAKIGQGGFGAVFRAVHPLIGKVVAVKVLARKFSVDAEMVSRFIAEARAVNQIRHRHIIDIFSFGQLADGRHYYVMEHLEGEPLDARLDRDGLIPLAEALPILRSIARALDAAHAKGIAHRDLKPENVFLVADPEGVWPKLLDFGIAKLMATDEGQKHKTQTGIPIGTPYYMSPEQCRGKDVDHRTDFYAFGIVAYKMLTGVQPIDGDGHLAVMMHQMTDEPAAPSTLNADLPQGIDDAIAWLMKKDPSERPPNLITAMRALEQAAEDSGIAIPRSAPSAAWDIATGPGVTPPLATLSRIRTATPSAKTPAPGTAALAMTAPSGVMPVGAPEKSRTRLFVVGGCGAIVLGAVVFFVAPRHHEPAQVVPVPLAAPPTLPANPAPPPPSPPPAPAPTPVAEPAMITITFDGVPVDTEVVLGGKPIARIPGPVTLERGTARIELTLRHPGFAPTHQAVVPDHEKTLHVKLRHLAAAPATLGNPPPDPHDIQNPFSK